MAAKKSELYCNRMFRDTVRTSEYYQGVGTRMVQRSHTAMESSTQLVGDCMPGLLRMMMMIELDIRVTTARTCKDKSLMPEKM